MNVLALSLGLLLVCMIGHVAVKCAEGRLRVLSRVERLAWSMILGPTLSMFLVFAASAAGLVKLSMTGFLAVLLPSLVVLFLIGRRLKSPAPMIDAPGASPLPKLIRWIMLLCIAVAGIQLMFGLFDLTMIPTYWDDSFNNWNMRGKIFFTTQELTLEIPLGNDTIQTAQGVSSYPPTLPLLKTFVSVLRGSFEEPLINAVQGIWPIGMLLLFFGTLRRRFVRLTSLFGTALLATLPHLMIQMSNPYGEILVASHILVAITAIVGAVQSDGPARATWLRLFALGLGLLLFTKNEATVIYAPILALLSVPLLRKDPKTAVQSLLLVLVLALPWVLFKWSHGLTFGNAKAASEVRFAFSGLALQAIWHHLTTEPNLLFLPLSLLLALLLAGRRAFRGPLAPLSIFVLSAFALQMLLFLFVGALETEAVLQTGLSRGLTQLAPAGMLLLILLVDLLRASPFAPSVDHA